MDALGLVPTRPECLIHLGDPALLKMSMSEAAMFWQVSRPIGKRDLKSIAKKRKQADIEMIRLGKLAAE